MAEYGPKYRLVFYGNVMEEADADRARAVFARMFRLEGDRLARCFSGERVVLGRHLDEERAFGIQSRLEAVGIVTLMETEEEGAAARRGPDRPATLAGVAVAPATPPATEPGQCAACRTPLTATGHCPQCARNGSITPSTPRPPRRWWPLAAALAGLTLLTPLVLLGVLPAVEDLRTRLRVDDGLMRGREITRTLQEFVERTGFVPNSNLDAALPAPPALGDEVVAAIDVRDQALVVVRFREELPRIGGGSLHFVPQKSIDGRFSWRCDGGELPATYLPRECRPPEAEALVAERKFTAPAPAPVAAPAAAGTEPVSPRMVQRILSEEIARTADARRRMVRALAAEGAWPASNEQIGLPNARRYGGPAFRQVSVEPEGHMVFVFSSTFPELEGHRLRLVPGEAGTWTCEATLPPEYVPTPCP